MVYMLIYFLLTLLRCEHYNRHMNIDHFIDFSAGNGLLNSAYLEALFLGDRALIEEFEEDAAIIHGVGPRVQCLNVANFSTIKVNCCTSKLFSLNDKYLIFFHVSIDVLQAFEHRNASGILENPEMVVCPCKVTFRIYEPFLDY